MRKAVKKKIRNLISSISKSSDDYEKKFMKIKFNSNEKFSSK